MICEYCLKDKKSIEFQTDNSSYCNSCIKKAGRANLIPPARNKPKQTPTQKVIKSWYKAKAGNLPAFSFYILLIKWIVIRTKYRT